MDNLHHYDENELVEILPPVEFKCISTGRWTAVSGGGIGWESVRAGGTDRQVPTGSHAGDGQELAQSSKTSAIYSVRFVLKIHL